MNEKRYTFECYGNDCSIFEDGFWLKIEEIVDLLNELSELNEQLRKIGIMYQGYNPCENCSYCLENKLCCGMPVPISCDDARKNFVQGLCKNYKQVMKSYRRYDDE